MKRPVFARPRGWKLRARERERGGRRTKGRMENCKRWERRLAVGRKNRGSALVKEIIRGLIKYRAQLVLLL